MNKAAQALGRLGKGKPKKYSELELQRRSERMKRINEAREARRVKRQEEWIRLKQQHWYWPFWRQSD